MSNLADMTERHRQALTELAELGLSLARKLHAQAETVEDVAQAAEISLAFHRVSRSVRQTLALEAKLERDARKPANDNQTPTPAPEKKPATAKALSDHVTRMRNAVATLVYETLEREDADFLMEDVEYQLASRDPEIMDVSVETYIAKLKYNWGIPEPANQSSPKPPDEPTAQSSA